MGGGALKVEASHLRRLPVPLISEGDIQDLNDLGERLRLMQDDADALEIQRKVDLVLERSLGCGATGTKGLREISRDGRMKRSKHTKKRG